MSRSLLDSAFARIRRVQEEDADRTLGQRQSVNAMLAVRDRQSHHDSRKPARGGGGDP